MDAIWWLIVCVLYIGLLIVWEQNQADKLHEKVLYYEQQLDMCNILEGEGE